jgi:hypothetical protein
MRAIPVIVALAVGVAAAYAQPRVPNVTPAAATVAGDDLGCAARYTFAAFVIRNLDGNASDYYAARASAAGKRYLALHPGESEQSYASRVAENAEVLQTQLASKSLTPEALVDEIKSCEQNVDSLIVT